ncbi:MAG TPA: xanthine dehydrogenase family protein molybdopterin-binding subunit [Elusimicrobiota bacterium]|jgi:CO/xanthine dehydrogenase Mo-binding subunit|nr:xanthine dehydrogenase family protein molybdopterin-binding subunit [Elusimicrobiota bacterium]
MTAVGKSLHRREGPDKLRGVAKYIDDYVFPNCLHGVTLRSTISCGRVLKVEQDPAFDWSEFTVATAADIPGKNCVPFLQEDQLLLARDRVNHPMEPIALVAHASRERAYEALAHFRVEYAPEEPALTMEDSLRLRRTIYPPDNVFKDILISKGDTAHGFAGAHVVVEGEYRVPWQEQAYIENNGMAAYFDSDGTLVAMGSMQCPYYVHKALKVIFDLPAPRVRVIQTTTGGGFGGKEDYPSVLAGHAALLAWKAKRPVKIVYDRTEDMAATTKRHPAKVRHRSGFDREGRLSAQDIDVVMDGGAYMTLSPVVLSRGAIHAAGPYACPNVRIRARAVATNTPPNGAFRGFGAPQTLFAAELHMDKAARTLGLDPAELRRRNILREGSVTATGQVLRTSVGMDEALEATLQMSRWPALRASCEKWNASSRKTWRGAGLAAVYHGSGFTGSGEVYLASKAGIALTREGRVKVLAASTEIGQGTNTMFAQIAADALGIPASLVDVETPDTAKVPDSGPTVASRTCMVVGGLVAKAAAKLKAELAPRGKFPNTQAALRRAAASLCAGAPQREFIAQYEKPAEIQWDDRTYSGDAYGSFGYAAMVAHVEVDRSTYEVRVLKLWTAQEIGRAVNPALAEGQIIGGSAQAVGYALYENPIFRDGRMVNASLTNYVIPTAPDTPPMEVALLEKPYRHGPFGAKGLGEMPMDVPGPAIAAAVHHATGVWVPKLPILPEDLAAALPA